MESQPERWRYGVSLADQSKLQPLLKALERLCSRSLTAAMVVAAFHHRRVLPLMARRQRLFEMTPGELIDGIWLSTIALSDEEILCRVRETVEGQQRSSDLTLFPMRPSWGYISLGMRDVRASPPPVPKDAERRAENRAHAEAYKERKDAEEARRKRKSLEHDEMEKCRRQQRHDGLPEEPSPSSSSMDSSSDDDESEVGRGPLDHLPDVREMRTEEALESSEGRSVPADTGTVPPPSPPPLSRTRDAVQKLLLPRSSQKRQVEAPALAPIKALKVSTSSIARWVVDAHATIQCGTVLARADPKKPVAQGEATEAAMKQVGEEAPTPREAGALESGEAKVPSITKATEGEVEAPTTSEAKVAEAGASKDSKAEVADAGAPRTTKAEVAEAGAPRTTEVKVAETGLGTVEPAAQDAEMVAGQALGKEVVGVEAASTVEQPALTFGEGSSTLIRDLEARSLKKSMFLQRERDIWDQLQQQKDLLANANELLSTRSMEVEDLHLCCADMKAKVAMTLEQATPLAVRIKELTRVVGLKKEASWAAEASIVVQALQGVLHTSVKHALAVVSSHYVGIDLEAINNVYVVADDDEKAEEEVMKLVEVAEAPGMALAKLFKEEVVPPTPTADAGNLEF
ncbi:uncharacterized protein [Miscanthus floridulus]|uniref:uncharacterized protein n=1 Tax=Miscanthus floridulus TaxID=154761 RepID=UPI003459EF32